MSQGNWEGWIKDSIGHEIQFANPAKNLLSDDKEGINSLAIDQDDGDDYYMYTCEWFYEDLGLIPDDWNDAGNISQYTPNYISKYRYPKQRILGTSSGGAYQTFDAAAEGIYTPIIEDSQLVYVDNAIWERVDNINLSGPNDRHYMLDYSTGIITFGSGTAGLIPPVGAEIKIFITLHEGGVWEKVTTFLQPRTLDRYYTHIQAVRGKYWYQVKDKANNGVQIYPTDIITELHGRYDAQMWTGITYNERWVSSYKSLDDYSIVRGGHVVNEVADHLWAGEWDKGIRIYKSLPEDSHNFPEVISQDPDSYELKFFDDPVKDIEVRYYRGEYWNNKPGGGARSGVNLTCIVHFHEQRNTHNKVWDEDLEMYVLVADPWAWIQVRLCNYYYSEFDTANAGHLVQVGDQIRNYPYSPDPPYTDNWEPYKVVHSGTGEFRYWYKDDGGGSYTKWSYTMFEKKVEGDSTRLFTSIPIKWVYRSASYSAVNWTRYEPYEGYVEGNYLDWTLEIKIQETANPTTNPIILTT
jgi:hypothetical protein